MAEFSKPENINNVWASAGDRIYPGDSKCASGWSVEIPPRQYFNHIDYKQDQMLAHLNQRGISEWDAETEYQANKSYVQGSDGEIYKTTSTHSGVNPVGDTTGTWYKPFNTDTPDQSLLYPKGYRDLGYGLVMQWCEAVASVDTEVGSVYVATSTLPFPLTTVLSVQATQRPSGAEDAEMVISVSNITTTQVSVTIRRVSGSNTGPELVYVSLLVIGVVA